MAPSNPRIIVVDSNQGLYNIVRAALELLGRRPRLIETFTGDDAMTELRASTPDLLITAHSLSGTTNGPMLALMAKRELAALPVIVLGAENDPEMDDETISQSPYQYLRKPLLPEAFIRAMRIALDGPEAAPREDKPVDMMGPVPIVDNEKLRPVLFKMMREVGAMAAVLADRNGKVLLYEGAAGYVDRDLLASALGPDVGNTAKILPIIGDQPRVLKYYDGDKYDLFTLAVGIHHFVTLIFDDNNGKRALGPVKQVGGNAVNEMLTIIGQVAFSAKPVAAPPPAPAPVPAKAAEHKSRPGRKTTQETSAAPRARQERQTVETPKAAAPAKPSAPARPAAAPIANFDPGLLDALDKLDLSKADDLFSDDKMASILAEQEGDKITFEDALMQGIINNVQE
ncbi:MAG: response regulator [Anaerolineae bacterium]|nr:response regulator [Anaerolineae bacterium]